MTLTLTMLRCPDAVVPETRSVAGGEFSIGRGPENDWVLPDSERFLSKQHCVLAFRTGLWQVSDLSTNGTFLNHDGEPIGRVEPRALRDGDRLRLGSYEIEASLAMPAEAPYRAAPAALDPFAPAPFEPDPLLRQHPDPDPFAAGLGSPAINLPADYDPLAPEPAETPFVGPTQSDHSPHLEDAFAAPIARAVLPEDWDRDLDPPPAAAAPPRAASAAGPSQPPRAAVDLPLPQAAPPAAAAMPAEPPFPAPSAPEASLAAFLHGAGLGDVRAADPTATMEMLGATFRTFVSGLRETMIARAAVKSEMRIEATQIRSSGNNPLKFAADDNDALVALIGAGRRTEMGPVAAVNDALRDLRLHELATIAAMQSAVRSLLAEFDPQKLRLAAERGGFELVAMQKKASAWDRFEALHGTVTAALSDNFDSVFGRAFARAYERALAEASVKD